MWCRICSADGCYHTFVYSKFPAIHMHTYSKHSPIFPDMCAFHLEDKLVLQNDNQIWWGEVNVEWLWPEICYQWNVKMAVRHFIASFMLKLLHRTKKHCWQKKKTLLISAICSVNRKKTLLKYCIYVWKRKKVGWINRFLCQKRSQVKKGGHVRSAKFWEACNCVSNFCCLCIKVISFFRPTIYSFKLSETHNHHSDPQSPQSLISVSPHRPSGTVSLFNKFQ